MAVDRRNAVSIGLAGLGLALAASQASATPGPRTGKGAAKALSARAAAGNEGLLPVAGAVQTEMLQQAIDTAAGSGQPLLLPAGRFETGPLALRPGTRMQGVPGATELVFAEGTHLLYAKNANGIRLEGLVLDGNMRPIDASMADGLLMLTDCAEIALQETMVRNSLGNGISLSRCSGRLADSVVSHCTATGIKSLDGTGISIAQNVIADCGNNGIQIWRSTPGDDGTLVASNRVERIAALSGGSGENGNGINVFRAGHVVVTGNRITDCAFSAIRGNAASNIQMVANSCSRLGEVALYAEFGFEGAVIANNIIDKAASGIVVTNFNEGGRLAVVQGNLIRNLFRREHEPTDKRGDGIGIEADAVVTGNVVENAPTAGIVIGWGRYMRNVLAANNLIRGARVGIMITTDPLAGHCLISGNMISGAIDGAIRTMSHGVPIGPDLMQPRTTPPANMTLAGNVAT